MEREDEERIRGMIQNIGQWYKDAYPMGASIVEDYGIYRISFADLWYCLRLGYMPYYNDSIVKERVFKRLCELDNIDYDFLYELSLKAKEDLKHVVMKNGVAHHAEIRPALWAPMN